MDPNHWSNLNQQYAARLSAGGVPANPGSLPFLEQHGLTAAGLGALSSSLSPHSTLTPHIPAMSYGHTLPGSAVTQIFDTLTGQTYPPGQLPYKTVSVGQPAYTLDSPRHASSEMATSRFSAQSQQAKVSLFNTDPHTMKEASHSPVTSPPVSSEPSKTWGVASFVSAGGIFSMSGDTVITGSNSHIQEPPPAHTGNARMCTVQKMSCGGKVDYSETNEAGPQPPQAHNNAYGVDVPRSHMLEDMLKPSSRPPVAHSNNQGSGQDASPVEARSSVAVHRHAYLESRQSSNNPRCMDCSQGIRSHSNFSETSPSLTSQQASYPNSPHVQGPATPSPGGHAQRVAKVSHVGQPQVTYSTYNSTIHNYTNSASSNTMNYDPISPPTVDPESQSLSLQDFADISSHQRKIPMSTTPNVTLSLQTALQQQDIGTNVLETKEITSTQSVQSTSSVQHLPIQAVADSTTKPKRAGRKAGGGVRSNKTGTVRRKKSQLQEEAADSVVHVVSHVISADSMPHQQFAISVVEPGQLGTNSFNTISAESVGLTHINPPAMTLSQPTLISQRHVVTQDQPVFMTNSYGSTFIDPNKNGPLSKEQSAEVQQSPGEVQNPLIDPGHEAVFSTLSPKQKYRTKAEQKQMPTAAIVESIDDEFAHLAEEPKLSMKDKKPKPCFAVSALGSRAPAVVAQNHPNDGTRASNIQNILLNPPKTKPGKDFQSSFLSFLKGHKPETLSSVTNSAITVKPELPKYIPDPRPRVLPTKAPEDIRKSAGDVKRMSLGPLAFSDDDDSKDGSCNLSKAVEQAISQLNDSTGWTTKSLARSGSSHGKKRTPLSGRSRRRSRKDGVDKYMKGDDEEVKLSVTEVLPPREKVTRRAKEKAAEKRKSKKRKRRRLSSDEFSEGEEDDYVELTSSSDLDDKDYDSDKDPVWMPCDQDVPLRTSKRRGSLFSDDEEGSRKTRSRTKRYRSTSGRRGRPSLLVSATSPVECEPSPFRPRPITEDLLQFLSDDDEIAHIYEKGYFVIDRRDLTKYDNYPIWKIDAGSLLQKYEPIIRDGRILHKSLCTYSSWSDNIRERYKAIGVQWIQRGRERDQDLVEVLDHFKPRPVNDELEEDPLMQAFNVYVQILVSQALEPGFLNAVKSEEDDYYCGPTRTIDNMLNEKKKALVEKIKWTSNFQASIERYPYLSTGEETETPTQSCPLLKAVQLSGKPYVRDTLEECSLTESPDTRTSKEFLVSSRTATLISIYHSLHHFKHTLYKKCSSKVLLLRGKESSDQSDILDQCLQNRGWVHRLFYNFRQLLDKASTAMKTSLIMSSPSTQRPGQPVEVNTSSHQTSDKQHSETSDQSTNKHCTQEQGDLNSPLQHSRQGCVPLSSGDNTKLHPEEMTQVVGEDNAELRNEKSGEQTSEDEKEMEFREYTEVDSVDNTEPCTEDGTEATSEDNTEVATEECTNMTSECKKVLQFEERSQLDSADDTELATEDSTQLQSEESLELASQQSTVVLCEVNTKPSQKPVQDDVTGTELTGDGGVCLTSLDNGSELTSLDNSTELAAEQVSSLTATQSVELSAKQTIPDGTQEGQQPADDRTCQVSTGKTIWSLPEKTSQTPEMMWSPPEKSSQLSEEDIAQPSPQMAIKSKPDAKLNEDQPNHTGMVSDGTAERVAENEK